MNKIDEKLYEAAVNLISERFPEKEWEGAAAMYTDTGRILVSTAPDCHNDGVSLCHETGAFCEAYKIDEKITASICVSKDDKGKYHILTPGLIRVTLLFLVKRVKLFATALFNITMINL